MPGKWRRVKSASNEPHEITMGITGKVDVEGLSNGLCSAEAGLLLFLQKTPEHSALQNDDPFANKSTW